MPTTLQQYNKTSKRTYRHFSIPATSTGLTKSKKNDFFYVGRNNEIITNLVNSFDCGYAAENIEKAKAMLKRLFTHSGITPSVILIDSSLPYEDIKNMSSLVNAEENLKSVPFFIEGSGIKENELSTLYQTPIADDVISVNELGKNGLMSKISFWKKIKEKKNIEIDENTAQLPTLMTIAKRIFDIIVSSLLMIVLSPIFLLIVLALKIESKGPVFYISQRAGKGYRIFNFYKFRTMEVEANKKISEVSHLNMYSAAHPIGPVFVKIDNDPRITKLGAFLRKCSLDELPQLLNVFKGDMSLVGNRPLPLYEAALLTTDEWATRFLAPAGMTGLWQIRRKTKFTMSAEERIKLDINYAEKSNFLFDLWIMMHTPTAVIQRTNA